MGSRYQEARRAAVLAVLMENYYRIGRYDKAEDALPALENVAGEIERVLSGIPNR